MQESENLEITIIVIIIIRGAIKIIFYVLIILFPQKKENMRFYFNVVLSKKIKIKPRIFIVTLN